MVHSAQNFTFNNSLVQVTYILQSLFSYIHGATYLQQEMKYFMFECSSPNLIYLIFGLISVKP